MRSVCIECHLHQAPRVDPSLEMRVSPVELLADTRDIREN